MKTIIVPIDFSRVATNALKYAQALARAEKANIVLLHCIRITVLDPTLPGDFAWEEKLMLKTRAESKLKRLCNKINNTPGNVSCDYVLSQSKLSDAIPALVKKTKADLVVMGTKGVKGWREYFSGTNTTTVIDKTKCPVLAIPHGARFKKISHIAYSTDFRGSDLEPIQYLTQLAKLFKAKLSVLHVESPARTHAAGKEIMDILRSHVKNKIHYQKLSFEVVPGKELEPVFNKYIKTAKVDILSMSTHYRGVLDKLFGTGITRQITHHTKIPLLVFHYKRAPVYAL